MRDFKDPRNIKAISDFLNSVRESGIVDKAVSRSSSAIPSQARVLETPFKEWVSQMGSKAVYSPNAVKDLVLSKGTDVVSQLGKDIIPSVSEGVVENVNPVKMLGNAGLRDIPTTATKALGVGGKAIEALGKGIGGASGGIALDFLLNPNVAGATEGQEGLLESGDPYAVRRLMGLVGDKLDPEKLNEAVRLASSPVPSQQLSQEIMSKGQKPYVDPNAGSNFLQQLMLGVDSDFPEDKQLIDVPYNGSQPPMLNQQQNESSKTTSTKSSTQDSTGGGDVGGGKKPLSRYEQLLQEYEEMIRKPQDTTQFKASTPALIAEVLSGLSKVGSQLSGDMDKFAVGSNAIANERGLFDKQRQQSQLQDKLKLDNISKLLDVANQAEVRKETADYRNIMLRKAEERLKQSDEQESRRVNQSQINAALSFLDRSPLLKDTLKQGVSFDTADRMIQQIESGKYEASISALGTQLARAMGEVGVLTDADVTRYLGNVSWGRKLVDWWKRGAEGGLPPESIKEIKSNMNIIRQGLNKRMDDIYGQAEGRMKTAFPDLPEEKIKGLLGTPIRFKTSDVVEAPYGQEVTKDGKLYKWNSSVGKYQLK